VPDALLDIGPASVLVLPGRTDVVQVDELILPGGGRGEVFVEDGDTLVHVAAGSVTGDQLVRAVLRSAGFAPGDDVLDLAVVCDGGVDRSVLSADREHRLLSTRVWDGREDGPVAAVVGLAPSRVETDVVDDPRDLLGDTLRLLDDLHAEPSQAHQVHVFTRRISDDRELTGAPGDRVDDDGLAAGALAEADMVVASWGPLPPGADDALDEVLQLLRDAREAGARVLVRAVDGEVATQGSPRQPAGGRPARGTHLVEAPVDWLHGAPLT